ncbi:MAG: MerR family transcriptional regulator [Anaerolineales bacterium]
MSDIRNPGRPDRYLSLGRFAQAAGLSRKALRLYDQLDILMPDYVDPESGYRYYSPDQLERARFIRLLRAMEMPLSDVRRVLVATSSAEATQIVIESRKAFEMKRALSNWSGQFIPQALAKLSAYAQQAGATISGDPICFYYGPVNETDDGPVEICFPIAGSADPSGDIVVREIPAHRAAVGRATPEQSSYPGILDVWDAVVSWVQQNKFELTDDPVCCYEIWHEDETISVVQPFEGAD